MNRAILSLHTGGKVGVASNPIINPNNLKVEGWYIVNHMQKGDFILPAMEVRDFITKGIVVNDYESMTPTEDMIRLKPILDIKFSLIGKVVVTESKHRVGKVSDYAVDDGFFIQKIYVVPPLYRGLTGSPRIIDRECIIEITDKKIIITEEEVKAPAKSALMAET